MAKWSSKALLKRNNWQGQNDIHFWVSFFAGKDYHQKRRWNHGISVQLARRSSVWHFLKLQRSLMQNSKRNRYIHLEGCKHPKTIMSFEFWLMVNQSHMRMGNNFKCDARWASFPVIVLDFENKNHDNGKNCQNNLEKQIVWICEHFFRCDLFFHSWMWN